MIDEETEIVNRSFAVALDSGARTVSLWPRFSSEHRASETSARTGHVVGHFQAQGAGDVARDVPDRARTPFANKPCVRPDAECCRGSTHFAARLIGYASSVNLVAPSCAAWIKRLD